MGRDKCQIAGVYAGCLTGSRPYESHHESRSLWPVFLFHPERSGLCLGDVPPGRIESLHRLIPTLNVGVEPKTEHIPERRESSSLNLALETWNSVEVLNWT